MSQSFENHIILKYTALINGYNDGNTCTCTFNVHVHKCFKMSSEVLTYFDKTTNMISFMLHCYSSTNKYDERESSHIYFSSFPSSNLLFKESVHHRRIMHVHLHVYSLTQNVIRNTGFISHLDVTRDLDLCPLNYFPAQIIPITC